jgi:hypothetical protein
VNESESMKIPVEHALPEGARGPDGDATETTDTSDTDLATRLKVCIKELRGEQGRSQKVNELVEVA